MPYGSNHKRGTAVTEKGEHAPSFPPRPRQTSQGDGDDVHSVFGVRRPLSAVASKLRPPLCSVNESLIDWDDSRHKRPFGRRTPSPRRHGSIIAHTRPLFLLRRRPPSRISGLLARGIRPALGSSPPPAGSSPPIPWPGSRTALPGGCAEGSCPTSLNRVNRSKTAATSACTAP